MSTAVVLLLALVLGIVKSCDIVSSTQACCNGNLYDISALGSNKYLSYVQLAPSKYTFYVDVSQGITGALPSPNVCTPTAVAGSTIVAAQYISASSCPVTGLLPVTAFTLSGSGNSQVLIVNYTLTSQSKSTSLVLQCTPNAASDTVVTVNQPKNSAGGTAYNWQVNTKLSCNPIGTCSYSSVGGIVVLSLFFGGLFLYFLVGAIYQWKAKQATGSELVIHKDFWFSLPGYIKAGCSFTWAKITRNEYQKL